MSIESAEYVLQKSVVLSDPLEIEEFQQLLKEDIYALRYDEMADSRKELANVSLLLSNDERSFFRIGRHYRGVEQWLEQKGYLSTIQITPEEVAYIEVARVTNQSNQWIHPEEIFGKVYSLDQRYEIESQIIRLEDQEDIAQALQLYGGYSGQEMYYVMFTTIKGKEFYGSFREKQLPAFMSNYF
ncbi:hypothetical protein [Caldalkalibacillus mannanilyticus]|uniref:hypothetical protein n=1 Tax=Caldalkalibacillus mannanilyticus TaxID=1418 RepID=UPI0004699A82|nr:hypothetical protein [Caldalkalibacillus mannanilyticus]